MSVAQITTSTVVAASKYNEIRQNTLTVLQDRYGYPYPLSSPVNPGNSITVDQWRNLYYDTNRCWVHQTGTSRVVLLPQTSGTVTAQFVNTLISTSNDINTFYKSTVRSQQSTATDTTSTVILTSTAYTRNLTYTWLNNTDLNYYFNLGGRIAFELSTATNAVSVNEKDLEILYRQLTTATQMAYTNAHYPSAYINTLTYNSNIVEVEYTTSTNSVSARLTLTPKAAAATNLPTTLASVVYYSTGSTVNTDYFFGIPAPRPGVSIKRLSIDPLLSFDCGNVGNTSAAQTVTLRNLGSSAVTISRIYFASSGAQHRADLSTFGGSSDYTGSDFTPISSTVIAPGGTKTFGLAYTGQALGTWTNSFTVISDNEFGAVTAYTQQTVDSALFNFSLTPSSYSTSSYTSLSRIDQKFTIVPLVGTYPAPGSPSNYSAQIVSASTASAFTLTNFASDGPTLSFLPLGQPSGLYTANMSVIVTGTNVFGQITTATQTATISIGLVAPNTQNLGTWTSALQTTNGVVGMSYDIIAGQRYLTIGVGMGSDGAPAAADPLYVDAANLGITGDPKYEQGAVLYPSIEDINHTSLLKDYGGWVRGDTTGYPRDILLERQYTITVPSSSLYSWQLSVDSAGYFSIDDVVIGDMRDAGDTGTPYFFTTSGTVDLSQGTHSLKIYLYNADKGTSVNPAGIALRLFRTSDNREIWNTLDPQRLAYRYWAEVYRIPVKADGTPRVYQSKNYVIKDIGAITNYSSGIAPDRASFNHYFGQLGTESEYSLFSVAEDGMGTLAITFNNNFRTTPDVNINKTLQGMPFLNYYNSARGDRITQLESPIGDGTKTRQFLGFNSNGSVITSGLVDIPKIQDPGYTDFDSPACPDPSVSILMQNGTEKTAGLLVAGDLIYTMHETSGNFGIFKIKSADMVYQPKVNIVFADSTSICVSQSHKFFVANAEWKQAFELKEGDTLKTYNDKVKVIYKIFDLGPGPVIKIEVEDAHTYIAAGFISHNAKKVPDLFDNWLNVA